MPSPLRILHHRASDESQKQKLGPYEIESLIAPEDEAAGTAYRVRIEPHQKTNISYHKIAEEFYYVLAGSGTAILNGESYDLKEGDFLRLPPGTTHGFITQAEPLVMLDLHTPGSRPDRDVFFVGDVPEGFTVKQDQQNHSNRLKLPTKILMLSLAIFVGWLMRDAASLPDKLATHFDGAGHPNGWMTRAQHLTFLMLFGLGMPAFVIGLCYSIRFLPASALNVPKAAYWRSPEHFPEACRILFEHSLWFASLLLIWMTLLNSLVVSANRIIPPHLDNSSVLLLAGGLLACAAVWVAELCWRFARTPEV